MSQLDQRRINFVESLSKEIRAKVLYEFLKKGTSNRNIERKIPELEEEDGWQAWSIIHFYGFDGSNKAQYPSLTLKLLKDNLEILNEKELEEFHLDNKELISRSPLSIPMGKNDGRDIFRSIKTRQGQYKLRKLILENYQSKCALCEISHSKLLITSHIKTWSDSSQEERIDPRNAILLCVIHDALFENGFISFEDNYKVLLSSNFDFDGQQISKNLNFTEPINDPPSPFFLKEHRKKHGYEKN